MKTQLNPKGRIYLELWRDGRCIHSVDFSNGLTLVGKNYLLEAGFNGGSQHSSWYLGIIDAAGFSMLSASDTMAVHAGWDEWIDVDPAARASWSQGTASSGQVINASQVSITLTAVGTLQGVFVVSSNTLSGTAGILWATALFPTPLDCETSDVLKLTYAVQM